MMKKFLLFTLLTAVAVPLANAQTDKSKYCPNADNIRITRLQKPWTYIYSGYNDQGNYFVSGEETYSDTNGPAPTIFLNEDLTSYEPADKKLSCVYYVFRDERPYPALVNIGDY